MNFLSGAEISYPLSILQRIHIKEVIFTKNVWAFSRDKVNCLFQRGVRRERFDCILIKKQNCGGGGGGGGGLKQNCGGGGFILIKRQNCGGGEGGSGLKQWNCGDGGV